VSLTLTRRLAAMVPILLGITLVAFAVVRAAPGDVLALQGDTALRAGGATVAQVREYRRSMGLDDPFFLGYARWLGHLVRGDLGRSFRDGRPVLVLLSEALPVTLLLALPSLLLGFLLAVPSASSRAQGPGGSSTGLSPGSSSSSTPCPFNGWPWCWSSPRPGPASPFTACGRKASVRWGICSSTSCCRSHA